MVNILEQVQSEIDSVIEQIATLNTEIQSRQEKKAGLVSFLGALHSKTQKAFLEASKEVMPHNTDIGELEMSMRITICLKNENIQTVGDLIEMTQLEILKTPHLGKKSLVEIKDTLGRFGLSLRT